MFQNLLDNFHEFLTHNGFQFTLFLITRSDDELGGLHDALIGEGLDKLDREEVAALMTLQLEWVHLRYKLAAPPARFSEEEFAEWTHELTGEVFMAVACRAGFMRIVKLGPTDEHLTFSPGHKATTNPPSQG